MRLGTRRGMLVGGVATASLLAAALAGGQDAQRERPLMAEDVFRNVQVLRGIPADQFMGTMGFFSASLGMSCEDCHTDSGSGWAAYADDGNPNKQTARQMIVMVSAINQSFFGGRRVVTCYSCHQGGLPQVTPDLTAFYSGPVIREPDEIAGQAEGVPGPEEILDRYIEALGGAERLAALRSFVARGSYEGFSASERGTVEVYARAPNQRAQVARTASGESVVIYDGQAGWRAAPKTLVPVPVLALEGDELDGARVDAVLSFPAGLKGALGEWVSDYPMMMDGREVYVVQGRARAGRPGIKLYFDAETGLLVRQVRFSDSPVGRNPTQIDYSDYRDVAGVKMPFRWVVTWLDGRSTFQLEQVETNVAIDRARFARPAVPAERAPGN